MAVHPRAGRDVVVADDVVAAGVGIRGVVAEDDGDAARLQTVQHPPVEVVAAVIVEREALEALIFVCNVLCGKLIDHNDIDQICTDSVCSKLCIVE